MVSASSGETVIELRAKLAGNVSKILAKIGRHDASEAFLERELARRPQSLALLTQHAFQAQRRRRFDEAATRWQALLSRFPDCPDGLLNLALSQRELHRIDDATATIARALVLAPDRTDVVSEAARIADRRFDHVEALSLWSKIFDKPGAPPEWRQLRDWNLVMLGRFDEADAAIGQSRQHAPGHPGHLANHAILRMTQGRWTKAIALLDQFRQEHPEDRVGSELLGQAMEGAAFAEADASKPSEALAVAPVMIERVEDPATRALLLGFESLGFDCEFGLVQRRYGAEPLGLLRWGSMSFPHLLEALASRFAGLGDADQTVIGELELSEYRIRDTRYGLKMHTFMHRHQVEPEIILAKTRQRLAYLRRRMIADLTAAEKVFVFKMDQLDGEEVGRLHRALRVYGPVTLLCVVPEDYRAAGLPSGRRGEVVAVADGLYIGFIERFGIFGGIWDVVFADWIALCSRPEFARTHGGEV